jgi:hypothetical protein
LPLKASSASTSSFLPRTIPTSTSLCSLLLYMAQPLTRQDTDQTGQQEPDHLAVHC